HLREQFASRRLRCAPRMRRRADCLWHYGVWVSVRPTLKKTPERAARRPRLPDGNTTLPQWAAAGDRPLAVAIRTRLLRRSPRAGGRDGPFGPFRRFSPQLPCRRGRTRDRESW